MHCHAVKTNFRILRMKSLKSVKCNGLLCQFKTGQQWGAQTAQEIKGMPISLLIGK